MLRSDVTACKVIDALIEIRLFREENEAWVEKAIVTRVWITCTTFMAEGTTDQLRELFDMVLRNIKVPFSAQATHATQTVGETYHVPCAFSLNPRSFYGNKLKPTSTRVNTKKPKHGAEYASTRC